MKKAPLRGYWSEVAPEAWRSHRQSLGHTLSYVTPATLKNAEHLPFAMAAGSVTAGVSWATVTLPAGRFTVAPLVTAQMISGAGADLGAAAMVTSVSASSFILRKGGAGSEVRHEWIAVQMTEGSAAG